MKIQHITTTNVKGQIVIPSAIRSQLGITDQVQLQLSVKGKVLYIEPISSTLTTTEDESSYLDVLKKTKGSWKNTKASNSARRKMELSASEHRKTAW